MTKKRSNAFVTLGASSHAEGERETYDFYATEPKALELLLLLEHFDKSIPIWECACGMGHLSNVLIKHNYQVRSSDLIDRGFGESGIDFLAIDNLEWNGNIITNPPFVYAQEFLEKALTIINTGNKIAMFMRIQFLEGKGRKEFFRNNPPTKIYISSSRLNCAKNGDFEKYTNSAVCFAWYVWKKGFKGDTIIKWFN